MIIGYFQQYLKFKYFMEAKKLYCNPYYFVIEKTITKKNISRLIKYNRSNRTTYKKTELIEHIKDD